MKSDLETKQATLQALQGLLTDAPLWQERDAWLNAHQPKLDNQDRATVRLLDEVDEVAKKHVVTITQPQHGLLAVHWNPRPHRRRQASKLKADWKNLVDFLYELHGPEKFIVGENADLPRSIPRTSTRMEAKLMVAKWYAPR